MKNIDERRKLIRPINNPHMGKEYIIQLQHNLAPRGLEAARGVVLQLHYIPEKKIMQAEHYDEYLHYFETQAEGYDDFENLAGDVLEDLNNELVPFWIHLSITAEHAHTIHRVSFEERQPGYDNPFLLARLKQIQ